MGVVSLCGGSAAATRTPAMETCPRSGFTIVHTCSGSSAPRFSQEADFDMKRTSAAWSVLVTEVILEFRRKSEGESTLYDNLIRELVRDPLAAAGQDARQ